MTNENLTIEEYKALLRNAETENRHLSWKLRLNEATARSFHVQDVINALAEITGGAVFLLDKELNVSFFGGVRRGSSGLSRELLKKDTLRFSEYQSLLAKDDEYTAGTVLENGDICYHMRFVLNMTETVYLLLMMKETSLEADVPFLFETAKACLTTVDLHRKRGDAPFDEFKVLMNLIINRQLQEWDEIDEYMMRLPNPPKRFMCVAVVRIDASRYNAINAATFISKLKLFFPDCSVTLYEDSFVLLISSDDKPSIQPRPTFNEKSFAEFLSDHDALAAFSNATQRMDMIRTLYLLAESTLRLGRVLKQNQQQRILFYEDFADYVMIDLAVARYKNLMGHDDIIFLTNPNVVQVYRHDKLYGTNLQTVLFNYCQFNGNISAAAKASFMHRNTFAAKIAEIRKLLPEDLDNADVQQRLLFSCKILQFINLYYDKQAPVSMTDRLNVVTIREQNYRNEPRDRVEPVSRNSKYGP